MDFDDLRANRLVRAPSFDVYPILALDEEEPPSAVLDVLPEREEGCEGERVLDGVLLQLQRNCACSPWLYVLTSHRYNWW